MNTGNDGMQDEDDPINADMSGDGAFLRRLSEFRVAVQNFIAGCGSSSRRGPAMHVSTIPQLLSEIQKCYGDFLSRAEYDERVKAHSKMRAKMSFVKSHLGDATRSCGSDLDLIAMFSDGIGYLEKKYSELAEAMPCQPRKSDRSERQDSSVFMEKRTYEVGFDGLMKNSAELRSAIAAFVSSYPKTPGDSIVSYVSGIEGHIRSLELIYRRFKHERDPMRIPAYLSAARQQVENVIEYLTMAKIICEYNHLEAQYSENLSFVEKKIGEFSSLAPPKAIENPISK